MRNRSLVLLSGEGTTLPAAEAEALFLTYDPGSRVSSPEERVVLAESAADPFLVGARIAFARRVGVLVDGPAGAAPLLAGHRVRFRSFDLRGAGPEANPGDYLRGLDVIVDLSDPEYELTLVRGKDDYLAVSAPMKMSQGWSRRRPRGRPYFHPSAMFPKLSRALVNLSRCHEGRVFLDPFCGTGSIPLEAHLVGARVVAVDRAEKMVAGSLRNMAHFGQDWAGLIRADASSLPLQQVDAVASDIPYGRASSTLGLTPKGILEGLIPPLAVIMPRRSFAVLMHPQQISVSGSDDFAVVQEHHLHVHKLLTRTITVLERR